MRRFVLLFALIFLSCEKKVVLHFEEIEKPKKEVSLKEGVDLFNTMRFKKSAVFFLKNLSEFPDDWRLNFLSGLSLLKTGKFEYAKRYLSRAIELSDELKDYIHYYLAVAFFENGELEATLEAIESLKSFTDSAVLCDGLLLRVKTLYKMELDEEVIKSLREEYLPVCPVKAETKVLELKVYCKRGEFEKAKEVFKEAWLRRDFSLREFDDVEKECGEEEVKKWMTREMVLEKMKRLMEEERWNDVISVGKRFFNEDDPLIQFFTGKALYYMRRLRDSKEKLEGSINALPFPLRCEAEFFLGKIAERSGEENAVDLYRRVYERYPQCEFADNAFFKIALIKKDENLFREFIKRFPNSELISDAQWEIAWSLIKRNDPSSVNYLTPMTIYQQKLNSKAIFWMTEAMRRNGNSDEANKILKNFMENASPDYYWVSGSFYVKEVTFPVKSEEDRYFNNPLPNAREISALLSIGIFELIEKEVRHLLKNYPERATEVLYYISKEYPDFIMLLKNAPLSFYYPLAYKDSVFKYSEDFSLDPYLILAVMKAESSFQRFAVSRANARGVMQIIKPTAIFISSQLQMENFELIDLFLPDLNIKMGVWYLKFLIDKFSELVPAISAYNAGPENVSRWCSDFGDMKTFDFIESIPFSETKDYVKRVIYYYAVYKNLYSPPFEPEKIFKERACVK